MVPNVRHPVPFQINAADDNQESKSVKEEVMALLPGHHPGDDETDSKFIHTPVFDS